MGDAADLYDGLFDEEDFERSQRMPVKLVQKIVKKGIVPVNKARSLVHKPVADNSEFDLPEEPSAPELDFLKYTILVYGREKIGKTTILSSFPDALFFCTEPGAKGLRIHKYHDEKGGVKDWNIFRKGIDALERNPNRFKTVVIDTVDRAYDMCLDWVCAERGIEYPGQDSDGKEDFGKSWRAVKDEFLTQIHRITGTGRGVAFTSHAKEETIKTRSGEKYTRIFPTMSGQARAVVEAFVDFFFYAEHIRANDGATNRILICHGDETIWAGSRSIDGVQFPQFLPMQEERMFEEVLQPAFNGEIGSLDPATLLPAKSTSKTGGSFIAKARTKSVIAKRTK